MQIKDIFKLQLFDILKRNGVEQKNIFDEISMVINENFSEEFTSPITPDIVKKAELFLIAKKIDGLSPRTLKEYKWQLIRFSEYVNKPVTDIMTNDIRMYIAHISESRKVKDITILSYTNTLKSFFSWLMLEEMITKNPCLRIKVLRIDKKRSRRALSIEELEKLRNACQTPRERTLVEFLYSTGCRLTETLNVKLSEINFFERSVKVIGKGNKERTVYFSIKTKLYLEDYVRSRKGSNDYLFIGHIKPYRQLKGRALQQELKKIGKRAGLKHIHPHLLRHTFATIALQMGMDITIIQKLLGHENLSTTRIYAETNQNIIKQTYDKLIV